MMIDRELAPVIIFGFNRRTKLERTVSSLLNNPEAIDTDIYIYIDGARGEFEEREVESVRAYAQSLKNIPGFKSVTIKASGYNKGLANSIIGGVSDIMNRHGRAIVLEDDLRVLPNFLAFMNSGLDKYEQDKRVYSICGYTNKVRKPDGYKADSYFCTRTTSWGWASWADRWNGVDWSYDNWDIWKKSRFRFNKWGGSDCFDLLRANYLGKNDSWAIRFIFNQFLTDTYSLFPIKSLVANDGFDGSGTHCKRWSRFKHEMMVAEIIDFFFPDDVIENKELHRDAMKYNSLGIRIWSKIMYMLSK